MSIIKSILNNIKKSKTKHHKKEHKKKEPKKKEHHKKKEHKEEKKKEPKQKQSQKQKQIVNIKIGGGGGNDDNNKRKNDFMPSFNPNIIFNPSLSMVPNALLNKPETNPPFYDIPQPNYNIPSQAPQMPAPQMPAPQMPAPRPAGTVGGAEQMPATRPAGTVGGAEPKPARPIPVETVGKTEPTKTIPINTPYEAIPQTEVSRPKEQIPELQIQEEQIKTKHDIHRDNEAYKKHIHELAQNYIARHPSVKDTEGLGSQRPISRIGEIATTIATDALTGGAVMVGEAA